jgi:hypothetical protein
VVEIGEIRKCRSCGFEGAVVTDEDEFGVRVWCTPPGCDLVDYAPKDYPYKPRKVE